VRSSFDASLGDRKAALRARMRAERDALPLEERIRRAALVGEALFAVPEVRAARTVLVYAAFGSELPTEGIAGRLAAGGARVLYPYLGVGGMEAADLRPGSRLVRSGYGPAEPSDRTPVDPGAIDVLLTPGLAFDRFGHRLGWGGGHFDRFFGRTRMDAARVGIGFGFQLVEEVPHGPGDEPVDLVVTDGESVDRRAVPGHRGRDTPGGQ